VVCRLAPGDGDDVVRHAGSRCVAVQELIGIDLHLCHRQGAHLGLQDQWKRGGGGVHGCRVMEEGGGAPRPAGSMEEGGGGHGCRVTVMLDQTTE
jgi:hypothetical protein